MMPSARAPRPAGEVRRVCGDDRGAVSVEAALALSALVVVTGLIVAVLATLAAHLAAVDAAGAAARAHAIGVEFIPGRGALSITESGGLLTATVSVPAPFGEVSADAVFPVEH